MSSRYGNRLGTEVMGIDRVKWLQLRPSPGHRRRSAGGRADGKDLEYDRGMPAIYIFGENGLAAVSRSLRSPDLAADEEGQAESLLGGVETDRGVQRGREAVDNSDRRVEDPIGGVIPGRPAGRYMIGRAYAPLIRDAMFGP